MAGVPGWRVNLCRLALAVLVACDDGGYAVRVHVPGSASRAVAVDVAIVRSCGEVAADIGAAPSAPLRAVTARAGVRTSIGTLPSGSYGLHARAWESGCRVYAAGCDGVEVVAGERGTLDVYLAEVPPRPCEDGTECRQDECVPVDLDAGRDAGPPPDAGPSPRDAGEADAGPRDAGADSGEPPCGDPAVVGLAELEPIGDGLATSVAVSGAIAYVPRVEDGLWIVDVDDPEQPEPRGHLAATSAADAVASGSTVFVAAGGEGLLVVDASDPDAPYAALYPTPGFAGGVALSGSVLYVTMNDQGVLVLDVSQPAVIAELGQMDTPADAKDIALSGDLAVVAVDGAGVSVADVSDPTEAVIRATVDTPGRAFAVALSGTVAFVADMDEHLQVVDFSDPDDPVLVGAAAAPGQSRDVASDGTWAYVADNAGGLQIFDASDPANPRAAGEVLVGTAIGLAVAEGFAYVSVMETGLAIVDLSCAAP